MSLVHAGFLSLVHSRSLYAWDSQQLAGSKVVLSRDHVVQKKKSILLKMRYHPHPTPPHPTPPRTPTTRRLVCLQVPSYDIIPPTPSHPPHPSHHIRRLLCVQVQVRYPTHPAHPTLPTHDPHSSMCASPMKVIIPPTPPTPTQKVCACTSDVVEGSCMYK